MKKVITFEIAIPDEALQGTIDDLAVEDPVHGYTLDSLFEENIVEWIEATPYAHVQMVVKRLSSV